jgi:hypothetical protein
MTASVIERKINPSRVKRWMQRLGCLALLQSSAEAHALVELRCINQGGDGELVLKVRPNAFSVVQDLKGTEYQVSWNPDFIMIYFRLGEDSGFPRDNYLKIDSEILTFEGQRTGDRMIQPVKVQGQCIVVP